MLTVRGAVNLRENVEIIHVISATAERSRGVLCRARPKLTACFCVPKRFSPENGNRGLHVKNHDDGSPLCPCYDPLFVFPRHKHLIIMYLYRKGVHEFRISPLPTPPTEQLCQRRVTAICFDLSSQCFRESCTLHTISDREVCADPNHPPPVPDAVRS